jgi:hypothetical protein
MTTNKKPSAAERRSSFLSQLLDEYNGKIRGGQIAGSTETVLMGLDYWRGVAERMASEGAPLGRTDRWKTAVAFAVRSIEAEETLTEDFARWAVIQGLINAGYASE